MESEHGLAFGRRGLGMESDVLATDQEAWDELAEVWTVPLCMVLGCRYTVVDRRQSLDSQGVERRVAPQGWHQLAVPFNRWTVS